MRERVPDGGPVSHRSLWRLGMPMAAISAVINILTLSGSFFMMIVYDDVLPGRSMPTLVALCLVVTLAYAFQAVLEAIRGRAMIGIGAGADRHLAGRVFAMLSGGERRLGRFPEGFSPLRDLDAVRGFLTGPGPLALLDLPWTVIYLALLFLFHWVLGAVTLAGLLVLVVLAVVTDRATREKTVALTAAAAERAAVADEVRRHAEIVRAHGMGEGAATRWREAEERYLTLQNALADTSHRMLLASRTFRALLQSLTLACGAALVVNDMATGGVILAGSILSARALSPIEQAIASWKSLAAMRESTDRLGKLAAALPALGDVLPLPAPRRELSVEGATVAVPGGRAIVADDVRFRVTAGDVVAVIGASGSGKSSLARALTGVWPLARGTIRLDGAGLEQWSADALGRHLGFMPQSAEMMDGTVAQNIARFDPAAAPEAIIAAARAAGLHEAILRLDTGYDTPLGAGGRRLSGGQVQRLALARALYGDPFLLVLDEPNAHLDLDGEAALSAAIRGASTRGAITVVVSHRAGVLAEATHVLIMQNGRVGDFTTRDVFFQRQREMIGRRPADDDAGDSRQAA